MRGDSRAALRVVVELDSAAARLVLNRRDERLGTAESAPWRNVVLRVEEGDSVEVEQPAHHLVRRHLRALADRAVAHVVAQALHLKRKRRGWVMEVSDR